MPSAAEASEHAADRAANQLPQRHAGGVSADTTGVVKTMDTTIDHNNIKSVTWK